MLKPAKKINHNFTDALQYQMSVVSTLKFSGNATSVYYLKYPVSNVKKMNNFE